MDSHATDVASAPAPATAPLPAGFEAAVAATFPEDFLLRGADDLLTYGRDWTKVYAPNPVAIALPRSVHEVSQLLALCTKYHVAVVPSGGRTGLAGGAVAARGELVVSLERMRAMGPVDELGATVRVEAGAITEAVHAHAEAHGLTWPVDFASKGSSQIGGNIATNAGGVKVIRYGLTRQWVLGLEVVLASGKVLNLKGNLEKNNTGLDLRQLFIGSEGTLGIITAATLKLVRVPAACQVMLFSLRDLAAVLRLFRYVRASNLTVAAYEFFSDACLRRLLAHRAVKAPFGAASPYYVLLEVESDMPPEDFLTGLFEEQLIEDGVLAQHSGEARELWTLREGISESLTATGLPHKNDIALPIAELEAFTVRLETLIESQYPGWEICLFGHVGDGNLHLNIMKPAALSNVEFFARAKDVDHAVFALVAQHHGSISAEHGIGLLKKNYLHYTRSSAEIATMRSVKLALDPHGILNPGKIFDM
jgi:FAD/FMN-containing dehydrogenase